jgi:predicted enzyme related to lactoylglutathione lyase
MGQSASIEESIMPASNTGRFVWHELHTTDRARAQKFYGALLPWMNEDVQMGPGETYGLVKMGGKDFAGITKSKAPPNVPPHWISYIAVEDVDATTNKAKSLGASVKQEPMDIPNTGRFAVLADPQGGLFALYKHSKPLDPEPDVPSVGTFCWEELMTADAAKAVDFYRNLFGYSVEEVDMGPGGTYHILKRGDRQTAGVMQMTGVPRAQWLSYIAVKDVDTSTRNAHELGANVKTQPTDIPNMGRFSVLLDPTGAGIAFFTAKPRK